MKKCVFSDFRESLAQKQNQSKKYCCPLNGLNGLNSLVFAKDKSPWPDGEGCRPDEGAQATEL